MSEKNWNDDTWLDDVVIGDPQDQILAEMIEAGDIIQDEDEENYPTTIATGENYREPKPEKPTGDVPP